MDSQKLKVASVFVLVYVALYFIGAATPLKDWSLTLDISMLDYMLLLLPATGFFFIYLLIPYIRKEFGFGKNFIYIFPALLLAASYFAWYIAIYWYYDNSAFLSGVSISLLNLDYFGMFLNSHFIYFVLAGIGGWGARMLVEKFEDEPAKA